MRKFKVEESDLGSFVKVLAENGCRVEVHKSGDVIKYGDRGTKQTGTFEVFIIGEVSDETD